jgi:transcriptional regulator with XRE-family HTH domain
MNDFAIGRSCRALRRRLGWRQADLAARAGVSQQLISRLERGRLSEIAVHTVRRVFADLDADLVMYARWRGGELDRLLDERHADIVGRMASLLRLLGWQVLTEVTFSEFGERGSIDILAWHAATRTLLVIEVKTEIASAEELLRRHDVKVRLAPKIARARFGGAAAVVGRLLVIAEGPTNRRRFARLEPALGAMYPARGATVRRWLRDPVGAMDGAIFVGGPTPARSSGGPTRVRRGPGAADRARG